MSKQGIRIWGTLILPHLGTGEVVKEKDTYFVVLKLPFARKETAEGILHTMKLDLWAKPKKKAAGS